MSDLNLQRHKYINQIIEECGTSGQRPLNVCVIGTYGAGKSSFINTVAAALNGKRWHEHTAIGDYGGMRFVTSYVQSFPKCCQGKYWKYSNVSLPNLIDAPGFQLEEDENIPTQEILRLFFFGKIGHGDALQEAREYCMKYGIEGLKQKYSLSVKEDGVNKIDRIVFVASARQNIPKYLIDCVVNAAQPSGSIHDKYKRSIPIFGVLTHAGQKEMENIQDLEKMAKDFKTSLGIAGHRLLICSNYCDDVDGGRRAEAVIPELDVPVLKFLVQVFDRNIPVLHDDETYINRLQLPSLWVILRPKYIAFAFAVIFLFFIWCLLHKK